MSTAPELPELLRAGDLSAARALTVARVKAEPSNVAARLDLVDLLILLGEWDKADGHADLAGTHDPARAVQIALTRQLIRAAAWRDDSFLRARPPELVTEPDDAVSAALARLTGVEADLAEPEYFGACDGVPFLGLRDVDDRTAGVLEVLSSTGKYMWVPFAAIASLRVSKPERARDLVWRVAELDVADGPSGVVYLPATYHAADPSDAQRLARETDWIEADNGMVTGVGARCFLIGDDVRTFDDFTDLTVERA